MGDQGFMKKNNIKNKNVVIIWKIVALLAVIAAVTGLFTVSKTSKGPKNINIAAAGSENTLTLDALMSGCLMQIPKTISMSARKVLMILSEAINLECLFGTSSEL